MRLMLCYLSRKIGSDYPIQGIEYAIYYVFLPFKFTTIMKHFVLLLMAIFIFGCNQVQDSAYTIEGSAAGLEEGTRIFLQDIGPSNKRIAVDTATVTAGNFTFYRTQKKGTGLQIINVEGVAGQLLLVKDDAPLSVTLYKDSLQASLVTGSLENELFNTYRNKSRIESVTKQKLRKSYAQAQSETDGVMVTKYLDQIKEMDNAFVTERKELIEAHGDKMVALVALSDLINANVLTGTQTSEYFDGISKDVQDSPIGNSIKSFIAKRKSQEMASKLASVGNKAPEFSAQTPDGKELSLSETLGEYTIIDFWASWCKPCRMENPNVVNVYKKYHDKGLNIISVSLDRPGQKDRWVRAIEKDNMDWYHVSNLQYWNDPIPKSYGVRSIPATFLLDKNGVIIAKNLRGRGLQNKMRELLGS